MSLSLTTRSAAQTLLIIYSIVYKRDQKKLSGEYVKTAHYTITYDSTSTL